MIVIPRQTDGNLKRDDILGDRMASQELKLSDTTTGRAIKVSGELQLRAIASLQIPLSVALKELKAFPQAKTSRAARMVLRHHRVQRLSNVQ